MSVEKEIGNLPFVALLGGLINIQDGLPKIKCIEVADTDDDYFENNGRIDDIPQMIRSLIAIDADSDLAIRIGYHTTTGSTKLAKAELNEVQLMRSCIGKDADGNPYLRLTVEAAE